MVNGKDQFGEFLITDDMLSRNEYRVTYQEDLTQGLSVDQ